MPFTGVSPLTKDPPGYDPEDKYKDPVLYYKHKEALVAEEYVKIEQAKVQFCFLLCLSFRVNRRWMNAKSQSK
jgi:hypothetical protein